MNTLFILLMWSFFYYLFFVKLSPKDEWQKIWEVVAENVPADLAPITDSVVLQDIVLHFSELDKENSWPKET